MLRLRQDVATDRRASLTANREADRVRATRSNDRTGPLPEQEAKRRGAPLGRDLTCTLRGRDPSIPSRKSTIQRNELLAIVSSGTDRPGLGTGSRRASSASG